MLTIRGFTLTDHFQEASALAPKLIEKVSTGQLQYRAHVLDGLESAIEGINLLFRGGNQGKLMVRL